MSLQRFISSQSPTITSFVIPCNKTIALALNRERKRRRGRGSAILHLMRSIIANLVIIA